MKVLCLKIIATKHFKIPPHPPTAFNDNLMCFASTGTATISCTFQRALRTALLRDGEASARVENGQCMTCVCEEGEFSCREPAGVNPSCPRYDPEEANRECMIDGEVVPHGQRREVSQSTSFVQSLH